MKYVLCLAFTLTCMGDALYGQYPFVGAQLDAIESDTGSCAFYYTIELRRNILGRVRWFLRQEKNYSNSRLATVRHYLSGALEWTTSYAYDEEGHVVHKHDSSSIWSAHTDLVRRHADTLAVRERTRTGIRTFTSTWQNDRARFITVCATCAREPEAWIEEHVGDITSIYYTQDGGKQVLTRAIEISGFNKLTTEYNQHGAWTRSIETILNDSMDMEVRDYYSPSHRERYLHVNIRSWNRENAREVYRALKRQYRLRRKDTLLVKYCSSRQWAAGDGRGRPW